MGTWTGAGTRRRTAAARVLAGGVLLALAAGGMPAAASVPAGPGASDAQENLRIGVVLRVAVLGDAFAGPQHGAPVSTRRTGDTKADDGGKSPVAADSSGSGGAGWTGIATAAGAGAVVALIAGLVFVRSRRRPGRRTTRGSA